MSLPVENTEFEVPEGSRLVLYTDGLIEHRGRDINDSLTRLRDALAGTDHTPEETCTAVLDAVLPARPTDDVALLIARTRAPAADDIAEWEVPSDPAAVADPRKRISRHLTRWGLEEAAFTTELILSELLTNAIRYATGPIQVRLLRTRSLICEVSDTSSASPASPPRSHHGGGRPRPPPRRATRRPLGHPLPARRQDHPGRTGPHGREDRQWRGVTIRRARSLSGAAGTVG